LEGRRRTFGKGEARGTEAAVRALRVARLEDPAEIGRAHEALLFLRAYPAGVEVAKLADEKLVAIGDRVRALKHAGADLEALEEPEISGIAGTGMTAVFGHGVARHLARQHGEEVRIAWEAWDAPETLGRVLPHLAPMVDEDAQVEPHPDWPGWVNAAARGANDLGWLLGAMEKRWGGGRDLPDRYDSLGLPVRWEFGACCATRTMMRFARKGLFVHEEPLIRRQDVRLAEVGGGRPMPVERLGPEESAMVLRLARETSAVRYRELHGFTYGDEAHVYRIQAGRGVVFYLSGVGPDHRLPLRAYHALTIWKSGVPVGYFEGLSLFERMEAGFNLYYTFREGETAWIYARVLEALHQVLGVGCFILDPYQIGHENEEAIASGAFWFYRKLGFRSVDEGLRRLTEREERKIAAKPGYRTPPVVLRRLVARPMAFEMAGTETGQWDGFSIRRLGQRLAGGARLPMPKGVADSRFAAEESTYLRKMQRHAEYRAAVIEMGS
jgi:hypothetical protein